MSKSAAEHVFVGNTTPITSYDPNKTNLGSLMRQISMGANPVDKFVGPFPVQVGIVGEQSTGIVSSFVHVIPFSDTEHWVFYAEIASGLTRRIGAYKFNIPNNTLTWQGFITLTYPATTNHTVRGLRVTRDLYTTGTVAVSGTAVTGTGTAWQTARFAVGARIGFGSTDPTQITTWYQISAIGSDTGITLSSTAGTVAAGTPFVIEELRVLTATTNATATNGGLHVAKGLHIEAFSLAGTTVPAATTVDNIRAVYWLADASTVTNDVIGGVGIEDKVDDTTQYAYCTEGSGTSLIIYKYNLRAALTVSAGKSTNAFVLATAAQTVVGNISQNNNGRVGTLQHGAGAGVPCFYFVTSTRVYRVPLTNITSGNATFIADSMQEIPPGGPGSYAVTSALASLEISTVMDRLLVTTTNVPRAYLTQYRTDGSQMDRMLFADDRQLDGAASSANLASGISVSAGATMAVWIEGGILYALRATTTAAACQLYVVPLGADWDFAAVNNERIITPKILTPGAVKYYRVLINELRRIGSDLLGRAPEPFRVYYRTAGIDDNSGGWTAVDTAGSLDGVAAAASIQFMFEFRVASGFCIPGRIHSLAVIYDEDDSLPSELVWNLADSSNSDGTVGFTQEALFSPLPTLTITYRRVDTDAVVLTQASGGNTYGTFEYWSGSAWVSGTGTNTVGLRRRFVPTAGLPTGVDVYAKIVAS